MSIGLALANDESPPPRRPGRDRLRQLRAFCRVARWESITGAAEDLGLSQPTVSQQMRSLEEELGTALLARNGPRISLTPAGERFYRLALPLVNRMDRLPDFLADEWDGIRPSEVRVAVGQAASVFILPASFKRFRALNPDTRLFVKIGTTSEQRGWLRDYEVDLAVGQMDRLDTRGIDILPLASHGFVFIAPLGHPLAGRESVEPREVASCPMILPTRDTPAGQWAILVARQFELELTVAVEVNGWAVMARYVEAGLGVALVPELCLGDGVRVSKSRVEWFPDRRIYGVMTRSGESTPPPARRFVELVASQFTAGS